MRKFIAVLAGAIIILTLLASVPSNATPVPNLRDCDGVYTNQVFKNVTVKKGSSCTIVDSTIHNVHGKKGAADIILLDSPVSHNIQVQGATGTVKVGPKKGCSYDPPVGNNVMIKNSHNVLLCYLTVDNNIRVTGNDGCITLRNNIAYRNITVARNKKFTGGCNTNHRNPEAIRVIANAYGNHLTVSKNSGRPEVVKFNGKYAD